jgi:hypothetical protein
MKVSAWTNAQESARAERARTFELLRSDARLGKMQALEQAQVLAAGLLVAARLSFAALLSGAAERLPNGFGRVLAATSGRP